MKRMNKIDANFDGYPTCMLDPFLKINLMNQRQCDQIWNNFGNLA